MRMRCLICFDVTVAMAAMLAIGACASSAPAPLSTPAPSSAHTPSPAPPSAPAPAPSSSGSTASAGGEARTAPASPAGTAIPGGAAVPTVVAQTSEERRAAIDRRLDDALGTFDAQLRKEQERIAKERDARQGGADVGASGDGSATIEAQSAATGSETPGSTAGPDRDERGNAGGPRGSSERRSAHAGDLKSQKSASTAATSRDNAGNGAAARNIPDGSDDDVVARRLRRAADQETDPELKDKLWKEYIDYKNNTGK
jgi:hypothetical protein